jgi:hypothetical protein
LKGIGDHAGETTFDPETDGDAGSRCPRQTRFRQPA